MGREKQIIKQPQQPICYVNGQYVPLDQAVLPIIDLGITRGYSVFDFFRIRSGVAMFIELHLIRLLNSVHNTNITFPYAPADIQNIIEKLVAANDNHDGSIRLIVTGGISRDSYSINGHSLVLIFQPGVVSNKFEDHKGLHLRLTPYERDLYLIKTTNYLKPLSLQESLKEEGYDNVLYYANDEVSESATANFFIVTHKGVIKTSNDHILEGITRKNLIRLIPTLGFELEIGTLTIPEVMNAQEAFLTSASIRVNPVIKIDQQTIGTGQPGPVAKQLFEALIQAENEYLKAYSGGSPFNKQSN